MKRTLWAALFLFGLSTGGTSVSHAELEMGTLLPASVRGWERAGDDRTHTPEDLFDYIDGGAELYLSFGFRRLVGRTYAKTGAPDIVVDIFDMGSSRDAFGVFAHSREIPDGAFGQGSQRHEGMLQFWKDHYYVSILASPETAESKEAVMELARRIEAAIPRYGTVPEILSLLPLEEIDEASIRYFHHHVWLNSYYFIADENILRIDDSTEAVLAKYGDPSRRSILLIVDYRSTKKARAAYDDFVTYYLPELPNQAVVQIEDGTWAGCERDGRLLTVVLTAPTEEAASNLLSAARAQRSPE